MVIDNDEGEFMKKTGYAYINLIKNYTGTPEFSEPNIRLSKREIPNYISDF